MCSLSVIEIIKITTVIGSFGQGRKEVNMRHMIEDSMVF